jgi:hypothetical protein
MDEPSTSPAIGRSGTTESCSIFVPAPDILRLHAHEFGLPAYPTVPVVCLPYAYHEPQRRVIALGSRGRGLSTYDPNTKNYTPAVELADLIAVLNQLQRLGHFCRQLAWRDLDHVARGRASRDDHGRSAARYQTRD